jgi:hypothetical protein
MSKSPLSGAFADSSATTKKKNKKNGAILLISGVALATSIGGVFAATSTITINGGQDLEFGQGLAAVDVCAASADTEMGQAYDATTDEFYVTTVEVTFNVANAGDCDNKQVKVELVDDATLSVIATETATSSSDTATVTFTANTYIAGQVSDIAVSTAD